MAFLDPTAFSGAILIFRCKTNSMSALPLIQQLRLKLPSSRDSGAEWPAIGQTELDRF